MYSDHPSSSVESSPRATSLGDEHYIGDNNPYHRCCSFSLIFLKLAVADKYARYVSFASLGHKSHGAYQSLQPSDRDSFSVIYRSKEEKPYAGKILVLGSYNEGDIIKQNDYQNLLTNWLDGYDGVNGDMGLPRIIIIPLAYGEYGSGSHRVELFIEPLQEGGYLASYSDPLGPNSYKGMSDKVAEFVQLRYNTKMRYLNKGIQEDAYNCATFSVEIDELAVATVLAGKSVYDELDNIAAIAKSRSSTMRAEQRKLFTKYPNLITSGQEPLENWDVYNTNPNYKVRPYKAQEDCQLELFTRVIKKTTLDKSTCKTIFTKDTDDADRKPRGEDGAATNMGDSNTEWLSSSLYVLSVGTVAALLGTSIVSWQHYKGIQLYISMPFLASVGSAALLISRIEAYWEQQDYICAGTQGATFTIMPLVPMAQEKVITMLYGTALKLTLKQQIAITAVTTFIMLAVAELSIEGTVHLLS